MRTRPPSPARVRPRDRHRTMVLVPVLVLAAACRGDAPSDLAADSALARDLALANTIAGTAEFNDAPIGESPEPEQVEPTAPPAPVATPRPATRAPQPRPDARRPAPRPREPQRTADREASVANAPQPDPAPAQAPAEAAGFSAGTRLALTTGARVCTVSGRPGDKLTATLRDPVRGTGGAMIPAGSLIVLEVASVQPEEPAEAGRITFRVRSLDVNDTAYPARGSGSAAGDLQRAQVPRVNASDRRTVATGAVAGAILGRVLGGDTRGAVIGAAVGGAAGAVKARSDQQFEGCLPQGSPVTIVLEEGLTIS